MRKKFDISLLLVILTITITQAEELLTIPNFTLLQVENTQNSLTDKDFRDKVIVLNIWQSACKPCIEELPLLQQLANQGISVYGINMQDNLERAQKFLTKKGNPYVATVFDSKGSLSKQLEVKGVPTTFVVDHGIVQYKKEGPLTEQDVRNIQLQVQKLIQK